MAITVLGGGAEHFFKKIFAVLVEFWSSKISEVQCRNTDMTRPLNIKVFCRNKIK